MIRPASREGPRPSSPLAGVTHRGDVVMLDIGEQLVIRGRQEFRDMVIGELEKGGRKFVIDFARTGYIDSAGLGVLISVSKQIRAEGGELALTNLNDDLRSLFHLTKLDTLFGIIESGELHGRGLTS